jgi:transcriptional regulator with XRE-family HTH domain
MTRDAFGPNLRRIRIQRGVSLDQIAESTKIARNLLAGLEQNDFSHWPFGIYARAYIRQYAYAIGVDPDATVDEFCRSFPQGDRRVLRVVREHAEIVGHDLSWQDEPPPGGADADRRGESRKRSKANRRPPPSAINTLFSRLRRALGKA